ncbi:hypothetical protein VMHJH2_10180 [Streptococcus uberis]|uniref:hypothetical protein n=1 Tax=Streptococcus uberis TaxID=1349 RepID=UPI0021505C27|nr:hypothetical protein [Streptococcus uberis]MCR4258880.1 hypothetical protein [Streptococcus uberis]
MVVSMEKLKEFQQRNSINENVKKIEQIIDKEIEFEVMDNRSSYKAVTVVFGSPNSTSWSGRGPLYFEKECKYSSEIQNSILQELAAKYSEAGYEVTGPTYLDIGMGESAIGIHLLIPNQLNK